MTLGTLFTLIVVVALYALVVRYMWRRHKSGKTSCGCGCSKCAHAALNQDSSCQGHK
ncbi:MAG: FeoB-associated Cys-rich membrane protein [Peptococcaceae bacterium]|nr:FeoB-associated Cys-rich membrane protein [Peptococcaceae bacterium]